MFLCAYVVAEYRSLFSEHIRPCAVASIFIIYYLACFFFLNTRSDLEFFFPQEAMGFFECVCVSSNKTPLASA